MPHGDSVWEFVRDGRRFTFRPRGRFTADSGAAELAGGGGRARDRGDAGLPGRPGAGRGASWCTLLEGYEIPPAGIYVVRPPPAEPVPMKVKVLTDIMLEKFGNPGWDACRRAA